MNWLAKLPPLKRRERSTESKLMDELEDEYDILFVKVKPSRVGLPDRMALGHGEILLVELKREGEDLDETQKAMHADLARRGIQVATFSSDDYKWIAECIDLKLRIKSRGRR